ncbi:Aste57867_13638 [Aphanomyces stellatus]|uniref:Aste57867_13638 protein n=1 Tax=Aphanomyces stellatus TaxID=120398 RepID=A0A485KZD4_9STRA|nr:hypothetical protein As57867_013588 [Aphanomyces stellatus]VFT90475.1 Aste57867_13638 [Aphanomyces stellatus]
MDLDGTTTTTLTFSLFEAQLQRDGAAIAENYEKSLDLRLLLQEISATMSMRVQAVESSLYTSDAVFDTQRTAVAEMVLAHDTVVAELNGIFATLKAQTVDPSMVTRVSGEVGKTLFDFVDADAVLRMQQEAQAHVNSVLELLDTNHATLDLLRATLAFYHSLDFNGLVHDASSSSASDHWDALADTCQTLQHQALDCKSRQLALLDTGRLHGDKLTVRLDESATLIKTSTAVLARLTALYDIALEYFVDMEQCDRRILSTFAAMHDVSQAYDTRVVDCHALLDELTNLLRFYQHFVHAYEALPHELARRHAHDTATRRLVDNIRQQLDQHEDLERQRRQAFAADHLRFLPSSLCPSIKNMPLHAIVSIQPDTASTETPPSTTSVSSD